MDPHIYRARARAAAGKTPGASGNEWSLLLQEMKAMRKDNEKILAKIQNVERGEENVSPAS